MGDYLFVHDCRVDYDEERPHLTSLQKVTAFRLIEYFGSIKYLVRRGKEIKHSEDYENFECIFLKNSKKIKGYLKNSYYNKKEIKKQVLGADAVVCRIPSKNARIAAKYAHKSNKPYLIEMVGCPWDSLWNHSVLGKLVAPFEYLLTRLTVKKAPYVVYVSEEFLQNRYPTKGKNTGVSDVKIAKITDEVVAKRLEKFKTAEKKNITLMTSAAVNVKYKGQEYVIKAIKNLKEAGINVTYKLAGGGSYERLLNIAKKYDVEENVIFLGSLSHDEVFKNLDETDIYVQPSLQEGLPRALVEAMSRGCICIGARTGGIPELLQERFVLRRKSVKDIVNVIKNICEIEDWETIAKENFEKAKEYEETKLDKKRNEFYKMVKEEVENG